MRQIDLIGIDWKNDDAKDRRSVTGSPALYYKEPIRLLEKAELTFRASPEHVYFHRYYSNSRAAKLSAGGGIAKMAVLVATRYSIQCTLGVIS